MQTGEQVSTRRAVGPTSPEPKPPRRWLQRLTTALVSLGPIAVVLTTYSLLLDHVPRTWFTQSWIEFVSCGAIAFCIGVGVWLVGQFVVRRHDDQATAMDSRRVETVESILAGTRQALIDDARPNPDEPQQAGWSQYLGAAKAPTAIGTAYGLYLVNILDVVHPRTDRGKLLATLRAAQEPTGGWRASSQRTGGRPEATAWVLSSSCRGGIDAAERAEWTATLESLTDPALDPAGMSSTTVVVTVLTTLAEVAPDSPRTNELVQLLIRGAVRVDEGGRFVAWGRSLTTWSEPSVALTARVVCALARINQPRPVANHTDLITRAIAWLRQPAELERFAERLQDHIDPVRRSTDSEPKNSDDLVTIGTFTAAWVARALLTADPAPQDDYVRTAIRMVCRRQRSGVWYLSDQQPIWMTAQGVIALREYALRGMIWPP